MGILSHLYEKKNQCILSCWPVLERRANRNPEHVPRGKKKEKAGLGSLFISARVTLSPLACSSPGLNLYHHTKSSRAQRRPRSRIPFTLMKRSSLTSVDSLNKWDPESPSPECHNSRRVENQLCLKRERGTNAFDTNNLSHRS